MVEEELRGARRALALATGQLAAARAIYLEPLGMLLETDALLPARDQFVNW